MCILVFELDDVWDSNGCVYIFCRPGSEGEETFPSPLAPPLAPSLGPSQEFSHVGKHTHENSFRIEKTYTWDEKWLYICPAGLYVF